MWITIFTTIVFELDDINIIFQISKKKIIVAMKTQI